MEGEGGKSPARDAHRRSKADDKSTQYKPEYSHSLALVIGINSYDDPKFMTLGKAEEDAQAVYDLLVSTPYNFSVHILIGEEATKKAILDELFKLRKTEADDRILVYFAGHGYTLTDKFGHETGYVAAYDTAAERDYTALELDEITDLRRRADAKHILFIFDSCFSGQALGLTRTVPSVSAERFLTQRAYQVISAGSGDQPVADFASMTRLLLEELRSEDVDDTTGLYTLSNLGLNVRQIMTAHSKKTQIPQFGHLQGSQGGDFVFRIAEPVTKLPQWILVAVRSEDSGARLTVINSLHTLAQGDDPGMADLALKEIQGLVEDKSSMVAAAAKAALEEISPLEISEPEPELHPSLSLTLSVKPAEVDVGGEAKWTATLRNDGDDDLRNVTVKRGKVLLDDPFGLAPGKRRRFTFTSTYETKRGGQKTETVTATGVASNDETVHDEIRATVQVLPPRVVTPSAEPSPRVETTTKPTSDLVQKHETPSQPAIEVLTIDAPIHLEMILIPAGEFLMGSDKSIDKKALSIEQPRHSFYIGDYYISKHPVTNEQYEVFLDATGHEAPETWKRFLRKRKIPSGKENHPVTNIGRYSCINFCEWLSRETGRSFILPSEAEWEKAARCTDGRIYPWGNEFDKNKLNSMETGFDDTTPVDLYSPSGDSPYGVSDLAGNVNELTRSLLAESLRYSDRLQRISLDKKTVKYPYLEERQHSITMPEYKYYSYPYNTKDGRERKSLSFTGYFVSRGGSFKGSPVTVRCAFRGYEGFIFDPKVKLTRDGGPTGFRVVVHPTSP